MSHKVPRKSERACGFRKGHPAYVSKKKDSIEEQTGESLARWMPRLTQAEFAHVTKVTPAGLIEIPDAEVILVSQRCCGQDVMITTMTT